MIFLYVWFLQRSLRITVEYPCSALAGNCEFNLSDSLKFTSVVRKNNRKQLPKGLQSQYTCQPIKLLYNRCSFSGPHRENQHDALTSKVHRQHSLSLLSDTLHGVRLYIGAYWSAFPYGPENPRMFDFADIPDARKQPKDDRSSFLDDIPLSCANRDFLCAASPHQCSYTESFEIPAVHLYVLHKCVLAAAPS